MTEELTPREHDDMRDLLLAGTQRIRPAGSHRFLISAGVAIVLIAGTVAGVTATALYGPRQDGSALSPRPAPTLTDEAAPTPAPEPAEVIEVPGAGTAARMRAVLPPAPGTYLSLRQDPILDDRLILGTSASLDAQGIDVSSAHGFQSVDTIHPWTANLKDGSGKCILIRQNYSTGGWSAIVCDAHGVPASVEREIDGALMRFTISGDAVDVYGIPR